MWLILMRRNRFDKKRIVLLLFLSLGSLFILTVGVLAAENMTIVSEIEERIEELQTERDQLFKKGINSGHSEIDDDIYFLKKQLAAIHLFNLARDRYSNALSKESFARYVGIYDSISIASTIMVGFLPESEREKFFDWYLEAQQSFENISNDLFFGSDQKNQDVSSLDNDPLREIKLELATLVQEAQSESLEDISGIQPDGSLHSVLLRVQELQGKLESIESMNLEELKGIVDLTMNLIQTVKNRQLLKYNLWAEKLIRSVDMGKTYEAEQAAYLYKNLGLIDLNLIYEPSLARAINERMYFLYEQIITEQLKAKTRYEAIFLLEKRKDLNDF